jgi:aspartyl aminopeptidase
MMDRSSIIQDLLSFLDAAPTAWHAVAVAVERLKQAGFQPLSDQDNWSILPNQRYFVTRNGSTLCAFITPSRRPQRLRLLASHTDSPGFKLKPLSEVRKHQMILLGVEIYGSPLLSSWLNRDLGIAGRVVYFNVQDQLQESLVLCNQIPITIPQLAIHLDRDVNDRGVILNKQDHLYALAGLESSLPQGSFLEFLLNKTIPLKSLIGHDLFLFPLENARLLGNEDAFLASYRIDSLASVHAALMALLHQPEPLEDDMKMVIFWDNEEVGSKTAQGAESPFFNQVIERIMEKYQATREDYFCLLNRSTCISIDLAHALHPNYADKHDGQHQPILGQGVVVKSNAQQRYATSALSSLPIHLAAKEKQLSLQRFVSRNDIPCGTTIGPLHASLAGMPTVDVGCGQLSMHACRELMACQDQVDMFHLLAQLLNS